MNATGSWLRPVEARRSPPRLRCVARVGAAAPGALASSAAVCFLFVLAVSGLLAPRPAAGGDAAGGDAAVFQLVTITDEGGKVHSVESGTAFFIDPDGTALTNSHVVYLAHEDPRRYQLLAIVGKEFYSATIVCASPLGAVPSAEKPETPVAIGRDVAEVRVARSTFPFQQLTYAHSDLVLNAHLAGLPRFSTLALGPDPAAGEKVRIVGYGYVAERLADPVGEQWTTTGTVSAAASAPDGTPVFRVVSMNRPRPGNSGSPVLDAEGRVVGMYTWNEEDNLAFGMAIGSSALAPACP